MSSEACVPAALVRSECGGCVENILYINQYLYRQYGLYCSMYCLLPVHTIYMYLIHPCSQWFQTDTWIWRQITTLCGNISDSLEVSYWPQWSMFLSTWTQPLLSYLTLITSYCLVVQSGFHLLGGSRREASPPQHSNLNHPLKISESW